MTMIEIYAFFIICCVIIIEAAEMVAMSGKLKMLQNEHEKLKSNFIDKITNVVVDVESTKEDMKTLIGQIDKVDERVAFHQSLLDEMKDEYIELSKAAAKSEQDWDAGLKSILDYSAKTAKEHS